MTKNNRAFTLIELMVVIVILGILAAILGSRIPSFVTKAKEGKTKGNLGTLRSTINIYYSDNDGKYPIDDLTCLIPKYLTKTLNCEVPPFHSATSQISNGTMVGNSDTGRFQYNKTESNQTWGSIWVECQHTDSSGGWWSSF